MARRKSSISRQHYAKALETEKSGDIHTALKQYQKASSNDAANVKAWNRQMILYRKSKTSEQEIKLIKTAISQYKQKVSDNHQLWLKAHQQKAESSRALAKVLGMLGENGLPKAENPIVDKWETRLYLLEYKVKNARNKKVKKSINKGIVKKTKN